MRAAVHARRASWPALPGVKLLNRRFLQRVHGALPKPAAPVVDALAERGILGGVPVSRLYPDEATAGEPAAARRHRNQHRCGRGCACRRAAGGAEMTARSHHRNLQRQPRAADRRAADLRAGPGGPHRRRSAGAAAGQGPSRRLEAQGRDRPARPVRAAGDPPLHAASARRTTPSTWGSIRWAPAP